MLTASVMDVASEAPSPLLVLALSSWCCGLRSAALVTLSGITL